MRTEHGLDRFVTFLDAVVAIAITLLVLPLAEIVQGVDPGKSLGSVLSGESGQFFAFFLSFAVIAASGWSTTGWSRAWAPTTRRSCC